eukprot:944452-Rhodomonas_salina.1
MERMGALERTKCFGEQRVLLSRQGLKWVALGRYGLKSVNMSKHYVGLKVTPEDMKRYNPPPTLSALLIPSSSFLFLPVAPS